MGKKKTILKGEGGVTQKRETEKREKANRNGISFLSFLPPHCCRLDILLYVNIHGHIRSTGGTLCSHGIYAGNLPCKVDIIAIKGGGGAGAGPNRPYAFCFRVRMYSSV